MFEFIVLIFVVLAFSQIGQALGPPLFAIGFPLFIIWLVRAWIKVLREGNDK